MPWQAAWRIPTEIIRKGWLDPALLASKDEAELEGLKVRPRWGAKTGAKTLSDAAKLVQDQFESGFRGCGVRTGPTST